MRIILCGIILAALSLGSTLAPAAELEPSKMVALDLEGACAIAIEFPISTLDLPRDASELSEVRLEWVSTGLPTDRRSEYRLYRLTESWRKVATGQTSGLEFVEDELIDIWEFDTMDFTRNGTGLVRFRLTDLGRDWVSGQKQNFGVVIVSRDIEPAVIRADLATLRLIVR